MATTVRGRSRRRARRRCSGSRAGQIGLRLRQIGLQDRCRWAVLQTARAPRQCGWSVRARSLHEARMGRPRFGRSRSRMAIPEPSSNKRQRADVQQGRRFVVEVAGTTLALTAVIGGGDRPCRTGCHAAGWYREYGLVLGHSSSDRARTRTEMGSVGRLSCVRTLEVLSGSAERVIGRWFRIRGRHLRSRRQRDFGFCYPKVRSCSKLSLTLAQWDRKLHPHRGALVARAEIIPVNLLWVMPAKGDVMAVVIVGAGVLGASAAFHLARMGQW